MCSWMNFLPVFLLPEFLFFSHFVHHSPPVVGNVTRTLAGSIVPPPHKLDDDNLHPRPMILSSLLAGFAMDLGEQEIPPLSRNCFRMALSVFPFCCMQKCT